MHVWLLALLSIFGSWGVGYVTLDDGDGLRPSDVRVMDGGIIPPRSATVQALDGGIIPPTP